MSLRKLMELRIRPAAVIFAVLLLAGATGCSDDNNNNDNLPRFEDADCSEVVPYAEKGLPTPEDIAISRCGFLFVPEKHSESTGRSIRLAVIIVPSVNQPPLPEPVVFLAGGPGGSALIEMDLLVASGVNQKRDLILMSQRGTVFADPELMCPEMDEYYIESLNFPVDSQENRGAHDAASEACSLRLAGNGIDISAYNTVENAADFADLRRALGIAEWNVFGVSYGTYLAQTLMYQHPEGIRTVTLDSVEPLDDAMMASLMAPNAREGLDNFFAACEAQPACAAAYPDLAGTFTNLVNELEANPITTSVEVSPGNPVDVVLDGGAIVNGIIDNTFNTSSFPNVPLWIDQLNNGQPENIARLRAVPAFTPPNVLAYGMTFGMICSGYMAEDTEESVLTFGQLAFPDYPDSVLAPSLHFSFALDDCEIWGIPKTPKALRTATGSNIRTLVVSGTFDAVTPPSTGVKGAIPLTNSIVLAFPGVGHAVIQSNTCAQEVFASFLDNPGAPQMSCAAVLQPAPFIVE
jgi:pimeloyl-ACP methyl ester carboxylesterase